jgi:hypothetical protein
MGDLDTTFQEDFLNVAVAQGEAIVKPDAMGDDLRWKTVILVSLGVSWWRHVGGLCGIRWVIKRSSLA